MKKNIDSPLSPVIFDEEKLIKKKKRKKRLIALLAIAILLPAVVAGIGAAAFFIWADGVNLDAALLPTASALPSFYDNDGNLLDYKTDNYISPDSVPEHLEHAFVALEDKRFYTHKGYDIVRMGGALINNVKAGAIREGGSTITQQLVKNTHLNSERTVERKLKELAIARKLEKEYDKSEIMAMYLAAIYFGNGAYGAKSAARAYFDKDYSELTLAECATLAGIVKNPSKYAPDRHPDNAVKRRNLVLSLMLEQGYIDEDECERAKAEKLVVCRGDNKSKAADFYIARAVEELTEKLNITRYQLNNSGLKIMLNLDSDLQNLLARSVDDDDNYSAVGVGGECVMTDNASGAVIAHVSNLGYGARRQAGSALKPLSVYAPAIDSDSITLATPFIDEPVDINGYAPHNFGGVYVGATNPREAIKKSLNSVAVKTLDYTGLDAAVKYLSAFGIPVAETDKNYSLALGSTSKGVTALQLASAYSAFANRGERREPSYIKYVTDGERKFLNGCGAPVRVMSEQSAYIMTSALVDTVRDGTAKSLSVLPFQIASKTGTVEGADGKNTDAWSVSYTSDYTLCVWHGADKLNELGGGRPTKQAANIWKGVYYDRKPSDFAVPEGVVTEYVDEYTTHKLKIVTAADAKTPDRYAKQEVFKIYNTPSRAPSLFTDVPECDFTLAVENGRVAISFEAQEIYDYRIFCTDALGRRLIAEIKGGQTDGGGINNGGVNKKHSPLSIGGEIIYTVETYTADCPNPSFSSSSKTAYIKNYL